mmetsp:Transcript_2487/g.6401  ORF Transcript_2487/g.6401 Transcript_2487/m.6401 type:complete len:98 (-) Transcript_2487:965-1258(-)|eukprot:CAMPEP_0202858966 /NCGR_PEP_ID=MMETSP1391-20130828/1282_1 /ASSEMBLY_ACC=CAM_ASM_000867 /TAXON_ID=1034604 /ORGANISM="Chlamydomonas leiostraca, Strain SAG 11-49" /LENGTH=97 /DNA_ID=CAMNT_0049537953 /DNA_START=222 /DNA_END=515 /DNA_ORIENTATION=+
MATRPGVAKQVSKKGGIHWDEVTEVQTENGERLSVGNGHHIQLPHVEGETEEERHARFEAARKLHSKKEALAEARRLAEEELRQAELEELAAQRAGH